MVNADGTVDYDASCDWFLAGRGTPELVVGGFPEAVSSTGADRDLLGLGALDESPYSPRELTAVLVPAPNYQPRTAHGVCSGSRHARDGTLSVDPVGIRPYAPFRTDGRDALAAGDGDTT